MRFDNFVDGQWIPSDEYEADTNPSDLDDVVGEYALATPAMAQEALDAAGRALATWRWSNPLVRSALLDKAAALLEERAETIAHTLAREEGKLVREARGELLLSSRIFRYFAAEPLRHRGAALPGLRDGFDVTVTHEPVGVVANITPWNFPLAVPVWKTAAALAYGNTVVLKPSEFTPATAVHLARVFEDAGFPRGVFNMVLGHGKVLGETLVRGSDAVSFTGSGPTGRRIVEMAAPAMTKVQLELGGKNPLVILGDCDIEQAIGVALSGTFTHAGQRCTSSSKIIVEKSVYDRVLAGMIRGVDGYRIGAFDDPDADMGPVANETQFQKSLHFMERTVEEGGELVAGGGPFEASRRGHYVRPALFAGTTCEMTINREEVFGPAATIFCVDDLDEAIHLANDCDFALSSGIFSNHMPSIERFRRQSKAGMVTVNAPTAGLDFHIPFGGRAPSGYGGREQGWGAAEFFTEMKATYYNHGVI